MYDANVVDKLIDVEKKILEVFQHISVYRFTDEDRYKRDLEYLKEVLLKKEEILIGKIPQDDEDISLILDVVLESKHNYFDEDDTSYLVLERFQNTMNDLLITLEDDIFEDEEYDEIDSLKNRKTVKNNLNIQFIKSLEIIKFLYPDLVNFIVNTQFLMAYQSRQNSNLLISSNFDVDSLSSLNDSSLSGRLDLNMTYFNDLKNDVIYDELETLLQDFLELLDDDTNMPILKQQFLRFKYLIQSISDGGLSIYKNCFDGSISSNKDNPMVKDLEKELLMEFEKRGLNKIEVNKRRRKIEEDDTDRLISLIKLEGEIYSLFYSLDLDNLDFKIFDKLSKLLDIEIGLVSNIKINQSTSSVIKSVIEEDLELFLDLDEDGLKIIRQRLFNVLDYFYYLNASPTQSNDSFDFINRNHVINSFKKFIDLYECSSEMPEYEKCLKNILFTNSFLTFDYVSARGNYCLLSSLSDEVIVQMLGMNILEYKYDKNEQLYERANEIMDYMNDIDDSERALCDFLLCEIEDIKENMSLDYLDKFEVYELPDNFGEDDVFGYRVSEIIREDKKVNNLRRKR